MALSTPLVLPLLLLLLVLPPTLRDYLSAGHLSKDAGDGGVSSELHLHPVILLPGLACSDLEARLTEAYQPSEPRCGALKGKGWFRLWSNASELAAHDYVDCFLEQMHLVYDPAINDYQNLPGVETRVPNFGSPRAFHDKNPLTPKTCVDYVREGLERVGYRDGDTLFGAPYDWRYAPPVPGQPSLVYSRYFQQLKSLVEAASMKQQQHGKKKTKVIIFAHSYGGMVALEFLGSTPPAWRDEYIKHLVLVAPVHPMGNIEQPLMLASGPGLDYVGAPRLSMRAMWRSFETALVGLPSPKVYGRKPLVITRRRNYSAHDMEDLLRDMGFRDGVEPFGRRMVPKMDYSKAPMVPMTCINGVGVRTPEQLVFQDGNYDVEPEIVFGDGDGAVNLVSMLAFDKQMRRQPGQKKQFKSIKIQGVEHCNLVIEERAVKRVMQQLLEANRI